jgi:hypothetical protein
MKNVCTMMPVEEMGGPFYRRAMQRLALLHSNCSEWVILLVITVLTLHIYKVSSSLLLFGHSMNY